MAFLQVELFLDKPLPPKFFLPTVSTSDEYKKNNRLFRKSFVIGYPNPIHQKGLSKNNSVCETPFCRRSIEDAPNNGLVTDAKRTGKLVWCPGGALPYMAYTGRGRWTWYGFWPFCPEQGIQFYANLSKTGSEPVLNRVCFLLIFLKIVFKKLFLKNHSIAILLPIKHFKIV